MTQRNDQVTANVQIGGMINYTPCSIEVGEVTTLPAGSDATVTNSGDEHEIVLDFGIPQGAKGETGEQGETGKSAYQAAVEAGYEGTEEQFGTSLITIDESATAAAASATAAAASATAASGSATTASNAATTATTKAGEAATSAANAATSASSAGSHATTAQNYATQASTYASNAANSATNAATYASNAASSASNAASMASSASTSASTASAVLEDPDFVAVAGAVEDISTVATNISDVTSVATDIAKVGAVADDLTNIGAVADDLTNIDTVATNISDVNATGQAIEDVSAVADNLTAITLVANDLENIDEVATKVAEWQKPADWVDIRSGAIDNSIYFFVGHSADYATYPEFNFTATISNSGTYDVYIDGVKYTTANSEAATSLMWQTLALTSGFDVTYPAALRTHIIRVTPSLGTDTITKIQTTLDKNYGVMWAHFNIDNPINIYELFNSGDNNTPSKNTPILEAVTAKNNEIKVSTSFRGSFQYAEALVEVPKFTSTYNGGINCYRAFRSCSALVKVKLKDMTFSNSHSMFMSCTGLKEVATENTTMRIEAYTFSGTNNLKKLPDNILFAAAAPVAIVNNKSLTSTFIDTSKTKDMIKLGIYSGTAANAMNGIKGITVSNSAPFSGTSPQINVSDTGLDRAALVNLFNSMPYNVGYTVVGSPTITDGVASGFSENDYVRITKGFSITSSTKLEIGFKLTGASAGEKSQDVIRFAGGMLRFYVSSAGKISGAYKGADNNTKYISFDGVHLNETFKFIREGSSIKFLSSTNGTDWNTLVDNENGLYDMNITSVNIGGGEVTGTYIPLSPGSIDLAHTYINIDGIPWFRGTAAMTKTCSVVGCTGTADLTADDKAIATGKGWELTVA